MTYEVMLRIAGGEESHLWFVGENRLDLLRCQLGHAAENADLSFNFEDAINIVDAINISIERARQ